MIEDWVPPINFLLSAYYVLGTMYELSQSYEVSIPISYI